MKAFKSTPTKAATALDQPARRETLVDWQNKLLDRGYSPGSVNIHLSAANGLLEYMGRRDLQLLQTAWTLGRERIYLMVKVLALTGIRVGELPLLTAEAVEMGWLSVSGEQRPIPGCLRQELLDYIARNGIRSGPVFASRNGRSLQRTQVTAEIQSLGRDARVEAAKCTPLPGLAAALPGHSGENRE